MCFENKEDIPRILFDTKTSCGRQMFSLDNCSFVLSYTFFL